MTTTAAEAAPTAADGIGVFYREEDYAGVIRRLVIDAVDVVVVLAVSSALTALVLAVLPWYSDARPLGVAGAWYGTWFVYFTLLKRSRLRTVGYWVGDVRIVNLRGERPAIRWLTLRLLFMLAGPFNFLVDLLWISSDDRRQALRDKFAGTYVVRRAARVAGRGVVRYNFYTILGTDFFFAEVSKAPPPPAPESTAAPAPISGPSDA